jgi:phosphate transport system substrate-binding protein
MHCSRFTLLISLCLCAASVPYASVAWGQARPTLDPDLPSYFYQESVSGTLIISGSDTMKPLLQAWADNLVRRHPKLKPTLSGEGSETGLAALLEHRTDIAAMSRRITAAEISEFVKEYGYEPTEVPVAGDALAIFVHKDNPVTGLSLDELDAMFCRERRRGLAYDVDSWGLVGLMDEWFEAPVRLYGRNGKSGTSYFFREEICKGGTFHAHMANAPGSASVVMEVSIDQQGIGFGAVGYGNSEVRTVPIATVKGGRYVDPSLQTAMDGSYPLRRNLYLYIAKSPKEPPSHATAELVRFALSAQGQQIALDSGYFPLPLPDVIRLAAKWPTAVKSAQLGMPGNPTP